MGDPSICDIAARLNQCIADLARARSGEANLALLTRVQLRYASHGSLAIEIAGQEARRVVRP